MIRAGEIYDIYYEKTTSGREVYLPIEETPDEIETSNKLSVVSYQLSETNNRQSTTNNQQLTTNNLYSPSSLPIVRKADYEIKTIPLTGKQKSWKQYSRTIGFAMIAFSIGGIFAPMAQQFRLEAGYQLTKTQEAVVQFISPPKELPSAVPHLFEPLVDAKGNLITPINTDFSIIVPSIGINAPVIANVNPGKSGEYIKALEAGVAHAKTSYLPNEDGTVYLFSHSTNYEWFIKDLNAVFYLLKNIKKGENIVLYYQGKRYTYKLTDTKVVKPKDVSYLVPIVGKRSLILQTCWPPGSVAERLLLFADLVNEDGNQI